MVKAGVMLDGNGLQPSSKGARVRFSGAKRTVIDGPFAETKELVAGYWILQVKSKAEAIEWMKRCPNPHEGESEIEIRQIFELEDFGDSEAVEHHRRLGEPEEVAEHRFHLLLAVQQYAKNHHEQKDDRAVGVFPEARKGVLGSL
jgi:hypothetical protein